MSDKSRLRLTIATFALVAFLSMVVVALLSAQPGRWSPGPGLSSSTPSGSAGGVLTGTYPNPGLASDSVVLGTNTSGPYAASTTEAGPATTALAFATDPTDCPLGQVQIGSLANGNAICTAMSAGVTDHGALTGLSDDDHAQYLLLAGRGSGQSIAGPVTLDSQLILPNGSNMTPAYRLGSTTDGSFGLYRMGGELRLTIGGPEHFFLWNAHYIPRDGARLVFGGDLDAGIEWAAPGTIEITNGTAGQPATAMMEVLRLSPRASAPSCSAPSLYVNSTASNTLCYCNGSTWVVISGPGPC